MLVHYLDDCAGAGGGDDDGVLVIVLEKLLDVPRHGALVHLGAAPDPVGAGVEGPCLPHLPVLVDQGLLGEQGVDAVKDHHQLTVTVITVQLQLPGYKNV